jgi:hypothetical protein
MTAMFAHLLFSAVAAFSLSTIAYVVWGCLTPGDFFGNGSVLVLPTIAVSFIFGAFAGCRASVRLRRVLLILAVLSVAFWVLAPDGWWVHPPPGTP